MLFRFSRDSSLASRLVLAGQWLGNPKRVPKWSHVEWLGALPTDGYGALPFQGVGWRHLSYLDTHEVWEIDCHYPTAEYFLLMQYQKPYDYLAALSCPWSLGWTCEGSWMCSELVAATLEAGGLDTGFTPSARVSPDRLYDYFVQHGRQVV